MASKTKAYSLAIYGLELEFIKRAKESIINDLKVSLEKYINLGFKYFVITLERGCCMWAGEVILELKQKYPQIKLVCVDVSKDNHLFFERKDLELIELDENFKEIGRSEKSNVLYKKLIDNCDLYESIYDEFNSQAEKQKNEWILNKISTLLVVDVPGIKGKTKEMIRSAKSKKINVDLIYG